MYRLRPAIAPFVILFASLALAAGALAADVRVYIQYAVGQKPAVQAQLERSQARTHHEFDDLNAVAVTLPEQARDALARNPTVLLIEEDPMRRLFTETTPYGIGDVQAPAAVAAGATGAGIRVGVIDSGVFTAHEDLNANRITGEPLGWNTDRDSHGTHVVGTLAAVGGNGTGVVGVSPGEVSIHMVKVFGDTGSWIYSSDLLTAVRAATAKGCRIISMSLGGSRSSRTEQQGMADLYSKGVLLIAAAGNDGTTATSYPAGYTSVISVAAVDDSGKVADFSQKNSSVELAAPGVGVLSTVSYQETNTVAVGGTTYLGKHIEFSKQPGTATGPLVDGGLGTTRDPNWAGKVVLVQRGSISFNDKVQNVQAAGGVACIIYNNEPGNLLATLGSGNSSTIPALTVSKADGEALLQKLNQSTTVTSSRAVDVSGYDYFDGTSMATPHVSGVAALIWSKYLGATNVQVRNALTSSATNNTARDNSTGYGVVQASSALTALAAMKPVNATDTVAPEIQAEPTTLVTGGKTPTLTISWNTDEPATSDVQIGNVVYPTTSYTKSHSRAFRVSKGATYTYYVISKDSSGNASWIGPRTVTIK